MEFREQIGVWVGLGRHLGQKAQKHETDGDVWGTWSVIRVGEAGEKGKASPQGL